MSAGSARNGCVPIREEAGNDVFFIAPSLADWFSIPESAVRLFKSGELVQSGGRGAARVVAFEGRSFLVRPYRRGGLPGKIIKDSFLYLGEQNVRGVKEFHLLCHLRESGLPVPKPALTTYSRKGIAYRCSIVLDYIPGVRPLADVFSELSSERWYALGVLLRRLHQHNVYHADLNSYNILVGDEQFYFIDFDKCYVVPAPLQVISGWWLKRNIKRLYRSLVKCGFEKDASSCRAWETLLQGYSAV